MHGYKRGAPKKGHFLGGGSNRTRTQAVTSPSNETLAALLNVLSHSQVELTWGYAFIGIAGYSYAVIGIAGYGYAVIGIAGYGYAVIGIAGYGYAVRLFSQMKNFSFSKQFVLF